MRGLWIALLSLTALLLGCLPSADESCQEGDTGTCVCDDERTGERQCVEKNGDLLWSICSCYYEGGGGNGGTNGDTNGGTNGDTNGGTNGDTNGGTNGDTNGGTNGDTNGGGNGGSGGLAQGVMDPDFGEGDGVLLPMGEWDLEEGVTIGADPQNRLVIMAYGDNESGARGFALWRLLEDGTLDAAFGTDGALFVPHAGTPMANEGYALGSMHVAILFDAEGKIVIAGDGSILDGGNNPFYAVFLARLNDDGTVDSNWGGMATAGFLSTRMHSAVMDAQGNIYMGATLVNFYSRSINDMVLLKFDNSGYPDSSFGSGGYLIEGDTYPTSMPEHSNVQVVLDAQDRLVAFSYSATGPVLRRYLSDGTLDTSFGGPTAGTWFGDGLSGFASYAGIHHAVGTSGEIFFANSSGAYAVDANGQSHRELLGWQDAQTPLNAIFSMGLLAQGDRLMLSGDTHFFRLYSDGSLDPGFNLIEIPTLAASSSGYIFRAILDDQGRIVTVGHTDSAWPHEYRVDRFK
jgi:uncharacterized delta-60 repeat protein